MGIGLSIVISVAIICVCSMITVLGVAGMRMCEKYFNYCKNKSDSNKGQSGRQSEEKTVNKK